MSTFVLTTALTEDTGVNGINSQNKVLTLICIILNGIDSHSEVRSYFLVAVAPIQYNTHKGSLSYDSYLQNFELSACLLMSGNHKTHNSQIAT